MKHDSISCYTGQCHHNFTITIMLINIIIIQILFPVPCQTPSLIDHNIYPDWFAKQCCFLTKIFTMITFHNHFLSQTCFSEVAAIILALNNHFFSHIYAKQWINEHSADSQLLHTDVKHHPNSSSTCYSTMYQRLFALFCGTLRRSESDKLNLQLTEA